MSSTTLKSVASGATFGAALTVAGVYSPSVIIGQLQLTNFHMLKTFLAASASSAIAILAAQKLNLTAAKPRLPNSLNWFNAYDGNIVGGALLGLGLALAGACPGTVLPQVVTGVKSGPLVLLGGVLGGILYSKLGKQLQAPCPSKRALEKPAVDQALNVKKRDALIMYEGMCLGAIAIFSHFFPDSKELLVPAAVGGLYIGASQAASLVLTGNTLGISTAYEQIGDLFWWAENSIVEFKSNPLPSIKGNAFAVGTMLGSYAATKIVELPAPAKDIQLGTARAIAGGAIMIFGSRIAGACTGGHGISGMSQLSIASIISVAAMFGAGIASTALLR